jgi:hypothetical protein
MNVEGKAGQAIVQDGGDSDIRLTRYAGAATCDSNARYWDAVTRGNVFVAELQAAATFGTALTATAVTLTLFNPAGSGKNLVLIEGSASLVTITAAGQVVYAVNDTPGQAAPTVTTALANFPKNALIGGGSSSVASVFTAATLPAAPRAYRVLFSVAATAATGLSPVMLIDPIDGKLTLMPGMMVTLQGITIAGSGLLGLMWEEVLP